MIAAEIGDIARFPQPAQARRLQRPLPARLPVRRATNPSLKGATDLGHLTVL
jgi:hypothetical protein